MRTWFGIIEEDDFRNSSSCMIGKATLEDFPKAKHPINKPLYQIHVDSLSSSIKYIEEYMQSYLSMLQQDIDGYME